MPLVWCGLTEEVPPGHVPVPLYWDQEEFDLEMTDRASGECACVICGKLYWDHPYAREPWNLSFENTPFLRRLCTGHLVKL